MNTIRKPAPGYRLRTLSIESGAVHRRHAKGAQNHVIGVSGQALDRLFAVRGVVSQIADPLHHAHDGLAER